MENKILFLTKYSTLGASSRYRTLQYIPYLPSKTNYEVKPLFDDEYLKAFYKNKRKPLFKAVKGYLQRLMNLNKIAEYDCVVLENELWPYLPFEFEKYFLNYVKRLVLIYDDAIFENYQKFNKNKIGYLMRFANQIIVGNQYLADYAIQWNAKVTIIPTVIDDKAYRVEKNYSLTSGKLKVIWVGSPATAHYLLELKELWQNAWMQDNVHLVILGASGLEFGKMQVSYIPWNASTEVEEIQKCDLGIMPLSNNLWSKGKCGFKIIQYMAAGLPSIASKVGANCKIIKDGETGFLVSSLKDWLKSFQRFSENPALIEQMGKAGKERAFTNYTVQATYKAWLEAVFTK